jgi:cysteine desulfurase
MFEFFSSHPANLRLCKRHFAPMLTEPKKRKRRLARTLLAQWPDPSMHDETAGDTVTEGVSRGDWPAGTARYFDSAATTCPPAHVVAALARAALLGNPSASNHVTGQTAAAALQAARASLGRTLRVPPDDLVFTSCATESANTVVFGVLPQVRGRGSPPHVVSTTVEHPCILEALKHAELNGLATVTLVTPAADGRVVPRAVANALTETTVLVSVFGAHGESGAVNDLAGICAAVRAHPHGHADRVLLHSDCTQSLGKVDLRPWEAGLDAFTGSAHKLYGPRGCGLLGLRAAVRLRVRPLLVGGPQGGGRRAGTENLAAVVATAEAFAWYAAHRAGNARFLAGLRQQIVAGLEARGVLARVYGPAAAAHRLPSTLLVALKRPQDRTATAGCCNTALVRHLSSAHGFCCSVGSACSTSKKTASPVLACMGATTGERSSTLRISLGLYNTRAATAAFVDAIAGALERDKCRKAPAPPAPPAPPTPPTPPTPLAPAPRA